MPKLGQRKVRVKSKLTGESKVYDSMSKACFSMMESSGYIRSRSLKGIYENESYMWEILGEEKKDKPPKKEVVYYKAKKRNLCLDCGHYFDCGKNKDPLKVRPFMKKHEFVDWVDKHTGRIHTKGTLLVQECKYKKRKELTPRERQERANRLDTRYFKKMGIKELVDCVQRNI